MLTKDREECFHCLQLRKLVLPDAMLCMSCDAQKRRQDREAAVKPRLPILFITDPVEHHHLCPACGTTDDCGPRVCVRPLIERCNGCRIALAYS
jgi:hypothetical protein